MLLDYVRTIRKNKDKNWDQYLTPEDWKIVNSKILESSWYPFEVYDRCGFAVFEIIAGGDNRVPHARGQVRGRELFEGVYKAVVVDSDPMKAIHRFVNTYDLFFNFSPLTIEDVGGNHVRICHEFERESPERTIPYCHQLMGILETLVEMVGGKDAKIELTKQSENSPTTVFDITWK